MKAVTSRQLVERCFAYPGNWEKLAAIHASAYRSPRDVSLRNRIPVISGYRVAQGARLSARSAEGRGKRCVEWRGYHGASPVTSRRPAHGLGQMWLTTPSS